MRNLILFTLILMAASIMFGQEITNTVVTVEEYDTNNVMLSHDSWEGNWTSYVDVSMSFIGLIDNDNPTEPINVVIYDYIMTGDNNEKIYYTDGGYVIFYKDKVYSEYLDPETKIKQIIIYSE